MSDVYDEIIESLRKENSSLKANLLTERRRLKKYKREAMLYRAIAKEFPELVNSIAQRDETG